MKTNRDKKAKVYSGTNKDVAYKQEWAFSGGISNITGGFDMFELGSKRMISRDVTRKNFIESYVGDIASLFGLNEGMQELLKMFLKDSAYRKVFKLDENAKVKWSKETGLSPSTVEGYFRALVSAKRLIKMHRWGWYRLNDEFIFHPNEVLHADFLSVNLTYVFKKEEGEPVAIAQPREITLTHIEEMVEAYKAQEARKNQLTEMSDKTTKDDSSSGV